VWRFLGVAVVTSLVGAAPAGAWTWPSSGPVLRPFVFGSNPYLAGQHRGVDVAGTAGAVVQAPAGGPVAFAGSVPGGGKTVTIETAGGLSVTLVHLGSIAVTKGAVVEEGDPVGTIGPSGDPEVPEPYVHLGVRVTSNPQGYVDPLSLLPPHAGQVVAVSVPSEASFDTPPRPSRQPAATPPASAAPAPRAQPVRAVPAQPRASTPAATPVASRARPRAERRGRPQPRRRLRRGAISC